jgi:hypothetical protein
MRRFGAPQPGRVRVEGGVQAYIVKSLNVCVHVCVGV